jgi:hypothetical protein
VGSEVIILDCELVNRRTVTILAAHTSELMEQGASSNTTHVMLAHDLRGAEVDISSGLADQLRPSIQ